VVGSSEYANEPSGFMKGGKFMCMLKMYQHFKKDSAS
jgi:hypothetical protein